jgi:hypothetical protein
MLPFVFLFFIPVCPAMDSFTQDKEFFGEASQELKEKKVKCYLY